ncbi:DDB1CUL4-associated and CUL4-associated factor 10-like [Octopus vulgaris]|uniref:DDB1CUL4-associated and CUL4-associated factor 10-like n=1 Tax=Octopus vulgaris TaxID=6645 RepID=A0AA36FCX0_OCTVU|nr:DDB1CUL4-associated and CUL4-associated factor 10-like [Octopus vulgaris]
MASYSPFEPWRWQRKRELGLKHALGDLSQMYCGLYSSFEAVQTWEPDKTSEHTHHGGIFNFDFSPEGSILVAACERQSILLFDPFNAKLIGHKSRAHTDCVNCVSYSVNEPNFKRVFHTSGLMRSKLTPDSSKIVISTTEGYLIVIHNLDLSYLEQDLRGFKPKFYRFMQLEQIPRRNSTLYNHVFERHRNRVEFISDFPGRDEACVIASLQIHPQGWCCLSRSTSSDENSEWTCLHDIQEMKMDTSVDEQDFEDFDEEMLDYSPQPSTSSGPVLGRPIGSMSPIPTPHKQTVVTVVDPAEEIFRAVTNIR